MIVVASENRTDKDSGWALTRVDIERIGRILARIRTGSIRGTGGTKRSFRSRSRGQVRGMFRHDRYQQSPSRGFDTIQG